MKKYIILIALISLMVLITPVTKAQADEIKQDQSQKLETEVICETGSYGEQTCRAKAYGQQKQKQYVKVLGAKTHQMAATALDTKGQIAALGIMATGALLAINKFKKII